VNSPLAKKAIYAASVDNRQIGDLCRTNLINAVERVLWREGRGEPDEGVKAIASVIWNRADHNASNFVAVIKQPFAFSSMAKYPKDAWTNSTYKWFVPFKDIS